jgi:7-carboxy-7-deazaguanine synthase
LLKLHVNEIFYSLQGEGMRSGTPNVFLRFSGCNQTCTVESHGFDCDTEFVSGQPMDGDTLVANLHAVATTCCSVILTGGEPALQATHELVDLLHDMGYFVAMETNGSVNVDELGLDWITVSPKVAEHAIRQRRAHEVKYVRGYGQGIPRTVVVADHYLLSPAFNGDQVDRRALAWCVDLVKQHPTWRLSTQQHKFWNLR